jgi:hypothetical protein
MVHVVITNEVMTIDSWRYNNFILYHKEKQSLLEDGKEVGLEVKAEKSKYMLMSRYQTTGQKS